jgi:signal transduction histidine kinase
MNLYRLLSEIIASYYNDFVRSSIEPHIELVENIKPVIIDENAARRIFSNLMQNLLRYGKNSAAIMLSQKEGYISTVFSNEALDLKQEDVKHLFDRFFTGDRSRTDKSTGLGLAITKQLVEQMGHEIATKLENGRLSIEIRWKV